MAKPVINSLKDLTPEQRTKMDTILQAHPKIEFEDFEAKLVDFTLKKQIFWAVRNAIKYNKYNFPGITGEPKRGPRTSSTAAHRSPVAASVSNGHTKLPLVNFTRMAPGAVEVIKRLDYEGYSDDDIRWIQQKGPSFLAQVLDPRMAFKIVKITEDDGSGGEIKQLELRRIS